MYLLIKILFTYMIQYPKSAVRSHPQFLLLLSSDTSFKSSYYFLEANAASLPVSIHFKKKKGKYLLHKSRSADFVSVTLKD